MKPRFLFVLLFAAFASTTAAWAEPKARVVIVVGPSTHPPGTHEVAAGGRLMKYCLENMANVPGVEAQVFTGWPQDRTVLDAASTIVFTGDTFPPQRLPETASILEQLGVQMKRGCGIVCVHYATGLREQDVAADGEHPLLHWMGGYFATHCKHHLSVAKIYPAATITPAAPQHPISRGWKEFTLNDEPYIRNYFGKNNNQPEPNVTIVATSQLPPEAPQTEAVAWAVEREDHGRGFGIVMPHFYRNWRDEDLRRCILNGIVWSAHLEVPAEGVKSAPPDLTAFEPGAVEPKPPASPTPAPAAAPAK